MKESRRTFFRLRRVSRRGRVPGLALALAATAWACAPDAPENPFDEARRAAITDSVRATLDDFAAAMEVGDWERLAEFYADDPRFRWLEDGRVRYDSKQAIVASLGEAGGSFTHGTLEYTEVEITPLAPGLAAFSARFEQRLVGSDGGGFSFRGVLGATLVHGPAGWRFLHGHTSTSR